MFPLLALTALASGMAGYKYSKEKHKQPVDTDSQNNNSNESDSVAKNVNTYNYYTDESENGDTLFNSQKKTKRTLFA